MMREFCEVKGCREELQAEVIIHYHGKEIPCMPTDKWFHRRFILCNEHYDAMRRSKLKLTAEGLIEKSQ